MKNFIQPGHSLSLTAPIAGVTAGVPVQIEQLLVVPTTTATSGNSFEGLAEGVFDVPKVGSQEWKVGALVYWDADNSRFTTVAAGHRLAGYAVAYAGSGAGVTTGRVYLDGAARTDEGT